MENEVESRSDTPAEKSGSRKWLIWPILIAIAFLVGLLPMWWSKRDLSLENDKTKRELIRQQILNTIASATIYARRGEYETARQKASKFFTDVQSELDNAESEILTGQERNQLPQLMTGRDEVITLLSRGDPASADRLSNLYVEIGAATGGSHP